MNLQRMRIGRFLRPPAVRLIELRAPNRAPINRHASGASSAFVAVFRYVVISILYLLQAAIRVIAIHEFAPIIFLGSGHSVM
ncbi:MAG: hypothetical protein DMG84_03740 [Acidobacteria bacterium]|nr:MAG: hypothetical protein DMG84_03740 [Acidobacteriota bacterium]